MDLLTPIGVLGSVALVFAALRLLSRPHTVVRVESGRASVIRGHPPAALRADLSDLARSAPGAAGRIEILGGGTGLTLRTPGLDGGTAQRVRNVVFLHRDRIR